MQHVESPHSKGARCYTDAVAHRPCSLHSLGLEHHAAPSNLRRLQLEEQSLLKVKQEQELLISKLSDSSSGAAF